MYRYFSSIKNGGRSSLTSLFASNSSFPSHRFSLNGHARGFSSAGWGFGGRNQHENVNANASARPDFMDNISSRIEKNASARPDFMDKINSRIEKNASPQPDLLDNINSRSEKNSEVGGNFRHMDFVRGVIEEDEKGFTRGSLYSQYHYEHDADFVHINMLRNNTFVTVTDSKGNTKLSGSAGSLKDMKSGQKLSRYAAEATAEVVGRRSRGLGLKSVVMKVKGFTHFRRKRQAILSWREGFTDSRGDKHPIVHIEDTTRRPHNGCRLPKKRRI